MEGNGRRAREGRPFRPQVARHREPDAHGSQFSGTRGSPSPEQLAALLLLLEGAEVTGVVAPYKNTGKP
jgi:hypothetical protein